MQERIMERLDAIEKKQERIISLLSAKDPAATKLESAEIFIRNCRLDKVPIGKAPDLIYPSIYATREHAVKAIKTLQKKGLFKVQGNYLRIKKG